MNQMEQWLKDWKAKSKKYKETRERAENLLDEISDPDMGCEEGYCYNEVINAMMQFAEKENTRLNNKVENLQKYIQNCYQECAETWKKLTEAKEIIKNIIRVTWGEGWNYSLDWKVKAEQFLDGESTTSNECHDCAKFDEMPKGPRCKTCDNGSRFKSRR